VRFWLTKPYDRPESPVKDLPFVHWLVDMVWPGAYPLPAVRCWQADIHQTLGADCTAASADRAASAPVVRWLFDDAESGRSSNRWMTSFIDLDTGRPGLAAGPVP
jgi:hypothetical protein